jgi:ubiquitin-conjugating enzyme E2 S
VNALKKDWQPSQGLRHTLAVIRCLLIQPNADSSLNEEAGRMLLENYDEYASRARLFTKIYAMPANHDCNIISTAKTEPSLQKKQRRSIKRL